MNLLIVDDEPYAVQTLWKNIHWEIIGIQEVYTAYSVEQAKQILEKRTVDILITDIEMPGGSGMELLKWVYELDFPCKRICMTCHAEFEFAQQALRYQAMDYLVKPINMKKVVETVEMAVVSLREERLQKEWQNKGILWERNKEKLEQIFWDNLLSGNISEAELPEMAARKGIQIDYNTEEDYLLLLFSIERIEDRKEDWKTHSEQMRYILYNVLRDMLLQNRNVGRCGWKDGLLWGILPAGEPVGIQENLETFLEMCRSITGASLVAYMEAPASGRGLHNTFLRLKEANTQNVSTFYGVLNVSDVTMQEENGSSAQFYTNLQSMLRNRDYETICSYVQDEQREKSHIDKRMLFLAVETVKKEIYRMLTKNHIELESFWDGPLMEEAGQVYNSTDAFEKWLFNVIKCLEANEKISEKHDKNPMITQVEAFILDNVEERITREQIAAHVNFSADYVARIFKKETGISISEYMMECKISRAKELIEQDEQKIGDIAIALGYNSFSYFSEVFKKITGVLPKDYKRTSRTEK